MFFQKWGFIKFVLNLFRLVLSYNIIAKFFFLT